MSNVRTSFGKELARQRIDRGLLLKDMADAADVTPAFLSAVEFGRKSAPSAMVTRIADYLQLDDVQRSRLRNLAAQSAAAAKIQLRDTASPEHREVAAALARRFADLPVDRVEKIRRLLGEEEED